MGVSRDFSDKLVFDFKETAKEIVTKYNLDHLKGTNALKPIEAQVLDFNVFVGANKAKPNVTESILEGESRIAMSKLEATALKLSKGEKENLLALQGAMNKNSVSESLLWRPVVRYAADEIDHLVAKYSDFFKADTAKAKGIDAKFARLLRYIDAEYRNDASKKNADATLYSVRKSLKRIEGYVQVEQSRAERLAKKRRISAMKQSKTPKNIASAYVQGHTDGTGISGVFGSSSRPPIRGLGQGNPTAPVQMYDTIQPGTLRRFGQSAGFVLVTALAGGIGLTIYRRSKEGKNNG